MSQQSHEHQLDERPIRTPVVVSGEIDLANADELGRALERQRLEQPEGDLVVDAAGLTFIDSTGLSVLTACSNRLREEGRSLRIQDVAPTPRRVFEITGLADLLLVDESPS